MQCTALAKDLRDDCLIYNSPEEKEKPDKTGDEKCTRY